MCAHFVGVPWLADAIGGSFEDASPQPLRARVASALCAMIAASPAAAGDAPRRAVRANPPWLETLRVAGRGPASYSYCQRVSLPFAGIGGPDRAMIEAAWPFAPTNVVEWRRSACQVLGALHGVGVPMQRDIMKIELHDFACSEGFIGGAPCVSFSGLGNRKGLDDSRGDLFFRQLSIIKELAGRQHRPLRWVLLENVWAITFRRNGSSAWDSISAWWAREMKGWTQLHLWKLDARACGLPQSRTRCFLVAFDRRFSDVVGGVPPCPAPNGRADLEPFLLHTEDLTDSKGRDLSDIQKANVGAFRAVFQDRARGRPALAIVDASRRPSLPGKKQFRATVCVNHCPTLTTNNKALYILRAGGAADKVPAEGRFVDIIERANFSGIEWSSVKGLCSNAQHMISFGNTIPVDLAGVALSGIMAKWAAFEHLILEQGLRGLGLHMPVADHDSRSSCQAGGSEPKRRCVAPSAHASDDSVSRQ